MSAWFKRFSKSKVIIYAGGFIAAFVAVAIVGNFLLWITNRNSTQAQASVFSPNQNFTPDQINNLVWHAYADSPGNSSATFKNVQGTLKYFGTVSSDAVNGGKGIPNRLPAFVSCFTFKQISTIGGMTGAADYEMCVYLIVVPPPYSELSKVMWRGSDPENFRAITSELKDDDFKATSTIPTW